MSAVVKGRHAVIEALEAGITLRSIQVKQSAAKSHDLADILATARQRNIRIVVLADHEFKRQFSDVHAQGIAAEVDTPLCSGNLDGIISQNPLPRIVLVLDHLEDPYNFGSLLRTCECLGITSVVFPKDRQAPITSGVIQSSSGAIYHLELYRVSNVGQSLIQLRDAGYWIYGTDVSDGIALPTFSFQFPCVIVLGNEAKGQSKRVHDLVDANVMIPMKGRLNSMNVSVSGGIILNAVSAQASLGGVHETA